MPEQTGEFDGPNDLPVRSAHDEARIGEALLDAALEQAEAFEGAQSRAEKGDA